MNMRVFMLDWTSNPALVHVQAAASMLQAELETAKVELSSLTETIASLQRQKAEIELGRYRSLNPRHSCRVCTSEILPPLLQA